MSINCHEARRRSTAYFDGRLRSDERSRLAEHLKGCEACGSYFDQVNAIRSALRQLPPPVVPVQLRTTLKVIASKERAEVLKTRGSHFQALWERWKFRFSDLMRPLALPATGGLISSLLLFGMFVLTVSTTTRVTSYDIPLQGIPAFEPNLVPLELRSQLVVLNMSFDGSGRITDYAVSDPTSRFTSGLQAQPSTITVPSFPTVFGVAQPVSGDIQIKFEPIAFRQ
jgi:hypothetical protein